MELIRPKRRVRSYMPSAKSLANLIPYIKGQNGHGRVYPLKERLQHALDHPLKEPKPDAPVGERIVYATLKGALDLAPHPAHLREVWDRVVGPVKTETPPPAPGSQVLNIIVVGGSENLQDILAQVKERTKKLAIGEG